MFKRKLLTLGLSLMTLGASFLSYNNYLIAEDTSEIYSSGLGDDVVTFTIYRKIEASKTRDAVLPSVVLGSEGGLLSLIGDGGVRLNLTGGNGPEFLPGTTPQSAQYKFSGIPDNKVLTIAVIPVGDSVVSVDENNAFRGSEGVLFDYTNDLVQRFRNTPGEMVATDYKYLNDQITYHSASWFLSTAEGSSAKLPALLSLCHADSTDITTSVNRDYTLSRYTFHLIAQDAPTTERCGGRVRIRRNSTTAAAKEYVFDVNIIAYVAPDTAVGEYSLSYKVVSW